MRQIVYIHKNRIIFSNSLIDNKKVDMLVENFDDSKLEPVTGLLVDTEYGLQFKLTDGNHRVKAMIKKGFVWIPAVLLTEKEYKHVAYSKINTIDLEVYLPAEPKFI